LDRDVVDDDEEVVAGTGSSASNATAIRPGAFPVIWYYTGVLGKAMARGSCWFLVY
jgi:hypothetical protein